MQKIISVFFIIISVSCFAQQVKVTRVVDGDTYVIETGEKVRMIGIDAPEMSTEFGDDARQHLQELLEGKTVILSKDPKNKNTDKYGRLLRYAEIKGQDINQRMVCDGFAIAYLKFPFGKKAAYKNCQLQAESSGTGIWADADAHEKLKRPTSKKQKKANQKKQKPATADTSRVAVNSYTPEVTIPSGNIFFYVCIGIVVVLGVVLIFRAVQK